MMTTLYKKTPSPLNPLGVKGVGEAGTIPAVSAIDTLSPLGVRINHFPLSPMKVSEMIRKARGFC